jgi:hypothetical protein
MLFTLILQSRFLLQSRLSPQHYLKLVGATVQFVPQSYDCWFLIRRNKDTVLSKVGIKDLLEMLLDGLSLFSLLVKF